jgi:drug/metabolite transporter (DMT)-like permease
VAASDRIAASCSSDGFTWAIADYSTRADPRYHRRFVLHLFALVGVLAISFSAVFVRLASVSPVTAAFYRAAYAVPVLFGIWLVVRSRDQRSWLARAVAVGSGVFLACDLAFWHQAIALIGVGLATVIANVQVVIVAVVAWAAHGETLTWRRAGLVLLVLFGLVLTSGLARSDAFGVSPGLGTLYGTMAGACYAAFLLTFRAANRVLAPTPGPLLDCTIGVMVGAMLVSPFDGGFALMPIWPAHGWLVALALVSQVGGWMLIATALPRLPAIETSVLLLVQPVFTLIWGLALFAEHPSALQWSGAALVLSGVLLLTLMQVLGPGRAGPVEVPPAAV